MKEKFLFTDKKIREKFIIQLREKERNCYFVTERKERKERKEGKKEKEKKKGGRKRTIKT